MGKQLEVLSYDLDTKAAAEIDSIGWNTGSAYGVKVDDKSYVLVQTDDGTTIYDITQPTDATAVFTVDGWTMRLMKLR